MHCETSWSWTWRKSEQKVFSFIFRFPQAHVVVQFCSRRSRSKTRRVEVARSFESAEELKNKRKKIGPCASGVWSCFLRSCVFYFCVILRGFCLVHEHSSVRRIPERLFAFIFVIRLGFPLPPPRQIRSGFCVLCVLPGSSGIRNKTKQPNKIVLRRSHKSSAARKRKRIIDYKTTFADPSRWKLISAGIANRNGRT